MKTFERIAVDFRKIRNMTIKHDTEKQDYQDGESTEMKRFLWFTYKKVKPIMKTRDVAVCIVELTYDSGLGMAVSYRGDSIKDGDMLFNNYNKYTGNLNAAL